MRQNSGLIMSKDNVVVYKVEKAPDGTNRLAGTYEVDRADAKDGIKTGIYKSLEAPIGIIPDSWGGKKKVKKASAEAPADEGEK